ncbi:MAG: SEC-C domain-containing protein [Clostridia bacterium]|nr:SEC-C domain-containing protein [Clostridia bacterium]
MFDDMVRLIREDTVRLTFLAHVEDRNAPRRRAVATLTGTNDAKSVMKDSANRSREAQKAGQAAQPVRVDKKPGRNDPCPCGSGKKYKACCGRNDG